jgi:hypothetical protein
MNVTARRTCPDTDPAPRALDELLLLDTTTLCRMYRDATVPEIAGLSGDLKGRMLAVTGLSDPVATWVRLFAGSGSFPWRGKSFSPLSSGHGEGKNRVIRDRWKLFRFETFVGQSRAGTFDAVQLDYDLPENPFFIRAIKDEIRQVEPGLYLGQAYLQLRGQPQLVLYFGLQSPAIA